MRTDLDQNWAPRSFRWEQTWIKSELLEVLWPQNSTSNPYLVFCIHVPPLFLEVYSHNEHSPPVSLRRNFELDFACENFVWCSVIKWMASRIEKRKRQSCPFTLRGKTKSPEVRVLWIYTIFNLHSTICVCRCMAIPAVFAGFTFQHYFWLTRWILCSEYWYNGVTTISDLNCIP